MRHLRRLWFYKLHPGWCCRKFVPDSTGTHCYVCGYDNDLHREMLRLRP